MNETVDRRRPLLIAIVCLLGGLGVLIAAAQIVARWDLMLEESAPGTVAAIAALLITAVCLFGLWRMKRWAVLVISLAFGARILYGLLGGPPLGGARLFGPALIVAVALVYWKRMD